jgi:hypothetical protein
MEVGGRLHAPADYLSGEVRQYHEIQGWQAPETLNFLQIQIIQ